jgi:N-acetylglucosamine malate deacetylase 2
MGRGAKRSTHSDLFGTRELARETHCAVIVAHPDDEVIGAGGLISRLNNVTVLHITDGVPGNGYVAEAGYSKRSDYAQARLSECRKALALANVDPENVIEFGLGGSQTPFKLADLTRRVAAFLRHTSPDVVLTHPYEGGHPDHDATAFATHAALRLLRRNGFKPPSIFEIAIRPSRDGTKRVLDFLPTGAGEITTLMLDEKTLDLKRQMFACFTTQPDLPRETAFSRERFRKPPRYDFALPPKGGTRNYENFGAVTAEWQELVREAWSSLFPKEAKPH